MADLLASNATRRRLRTSLVVHKVVIEHVFAAAARLSKFFAAKFCGAPAGEWAHGLYNCVCTLRAHTLVAPSPL